MVRELIAFIQALGYSDVMLRCDNEPSTVQVQKLTARTRQAMGLLTKIYTPAPYDHGNSLAENAVNRARGLAGYKAFGHLCTGHRFSRVELDSYGVLGKALGAETN